jgi:hypothetical protein
MEHSKSERQAHGRATVIAPPQPKDEARIAVIYLSFLIAAVYRRDVSDRLGADFV